VKLVEAIEKVGAVKDQDKLKTQVHHALAMYTAGGLVRAVAYVNNSDSMKSLAGVLDGGYRGEHIHKNIEKDVTGDGRAMAAKCREFERSLLALKTALELHVAKKDPDNGVQ